MKNTSRKDALYQALLELIYESKPLEEIRVRFPLAVAAYEGDITALSEASLESIKTDCLLHFAVVGAITRKNLNTLNYLLTTIADLESNDTQVVDLTLPNGNTALWMACRMGHSGAVAQLITAGADVNKTNKEGMTPLWIACSEGHSDGVAQLIATNVVEIDKADKFGDTPLHAACGKGHFIVAAQLIAAGADITRKNKFGSTPLLIACATGHEKIVRLLLTQLEHDKNNEYIQSEGWGLLDRTISRCHKNVIKVLLTTPFYFNNASICPDAIKKSLLLNKKTALSNHLLSETQRSKKLTALEEVTDLLYSTLALELRKNIRLAALTRHSITTTPRARDATAGEIQSVGRNDENHSAAPQTNP